MRKVKPPVPPAMRIGFALAMIIMGLLFIAFLALLVARSVPIDEGQEWNRLATAGSLRGTV